MIINPFKNPAIRRALFALLNRYRFEDSISLATLSQDYITKEIMTYGWYELPFLRLLDHYLSLNRDLDEETVFIDVGANIGNHALYLSKAVDHVIAIEPNPVCVNLLKASCEANNVHNIEIVPNAAGATRSQESLSFDTRHTGGGTLLEPMETTGLRHITINVERLDDIVSNCVPLGAKVELLKIDAEGFETEVITGATKLLNDHSPIVAFEAHGLKNYKNISDALRREGYITFHKLTQARRQYSNIIFNAVNMMFRPNSLYVESIHEPADVNYQMVLASKSEDSMHFGILLQTLNQS